MKKYLVAKNFPKMNSGESFSGPLDVNDVICFDVWLIIAEINPETFRLVRSINRLVRDHTNKYIDKYMNLFMRPFKIINENFVSKGYQLPDGSKHGVCEDEETLNINFLDSTIITSFSNESNYRAGQLHGLSKNIGKLDLFGLYFETIANYEFGILHGKFEKYYLGFLVESSNYKCGKLSGKREIYKTSNSREVSHYVNDVLNGTYEKYFFNFLIESSCYKDGKLHGVVKKYKSPSQSEISSINPESEEEKSKRLISLFNYDKGVLHGPFFMIDESFYVRGRYTNGRIDEYYFFK